MPPPKTIRTVIIGGGISGIAQAIRLKDELGDRVHITILEKRGSPGGVWRDSLWPDAGVDVPIHLYSLYSDLKPDWDSIYATQPEVLAYWESLIDRYALRHDFLFNSEFIGSEWSTSQQVHTIHVRNAQTGRIVDLEADVLISATGPLAKPVIPDIPGVKDFQGPYFHNLRWDAGVDFTGKRVAVIGNGSSGVQLVPGVSQIPGVTLTHYVRSGGYFIPKLQRKYSGFEKWAFRWIPGWIQIHRFLLLLEHDSKWSVKTSLHDPNREKYEAFLLDYLREKAPAEYLEALTPHYPVGTKRPALDLGWLDALHQPNVTLVSNRIARVTPTGIETADGVRREHDVIIYATGSDVPNHGLGANVGVLGEDRVELQQYWKDIGGPQSYAGLAVPKFPNYFIVIGPNSVAGSWGFTLGRQTAAIARIVRELVDYGISSVQPNEGVFRAENERISRKLEFSTAASTRADNWWRTKEGRVTVINPQTGLSLWWNTLSTRWADWDAVRVTTADGKVRLESVNVVAIKRRRRVVKAVVAGGVAGVLYWSWPSVLGVALKFVEHPSIADLWRSFRV